MDAVETSGKSVDDAVVQALARLGRRRDEVEVAVLQEPSRGVRGVGAKEARVRVWVKRATTPSMGGAVLTPDLADQWFGGLEDDEPIAPSSPVAPPSAPLRQRPTVAPARPSPPPARPAPRQPPPLAAARPAPPIGRTPTRPLPPPAPVPPPPTPPRSVAPPIHSTAISRAVQSSTALPVLPADLDPIAPTLGEPLSAMEEESSEEELPDAIVEQAIEILRTILAEMHFPTNIVISSRNPLMLNILVDGDADILAILIGKRGETLASLQLLVNLMVNHQGKTRYHVLVDAEDYRRRRDDNLRSLAARVARQVQQFQRQMALEPMTPYERRIVHMALQDSPYVQTQSTGEGDQRRVVVSLKPRSAR